MHQLGGIRIALGNAREQNLGGHVRIAELAGQLLARGQRVEHIPVELRVGHIRTGGLWVTSSKISRLAQQLRDVNPGGFQDRLRNRILLLQQGYQQVCWPDVRVALGGSILQCGLKGSLRISGWSEAVHGVFSLLTAREFCGVVRS